MKGKAHSLEGLLTLVQCLTLTCSLVNAEPDTKPAAERKDDNVQLDAAALFKLAGGQDVRLDKLDSKTLFSWDKRDNGDVLFYRAEKQGQSLKIELPVSRDGYYRIRGSHVHGPWKPGRFGLFKLKADGILMPGQQHGWYSTSAPKHWPKAKLHVQQVDWGAVYLRSPTALLAFERIHHTGGMFGITRLELHSVKESELDEEERKRIAPPRVSHKRGDWPILRHNASTSLAGKLPVWRTGIAPKIDGALGDWLRGPDIEINKTTIKTMGFESPAIQGNDDLSLTARMMWDDRFLYFAAAVRDDELAATVRGQKWKGFWEYDGVALLVTVPPWLRGTTRHPQVIEKELHFGLNYYTDSGPSPLPGGGRYVCRRSPTGYTIEAAIPFASLGLDARHGDRLRFFIIAVNRDPAKPEGRHFGQYIWNRTRGEIRLVSAAGAGAEMIPEISHARPGTTIRYVGSADVFDKLTKVSEIQLIDLGTGAIKRRWPQETTLASGKRHQLSGELPLHGLPNGRYSLRAVLSD